MRRPAPDGATDAEVIIEGLIDDEYLEPEGPFEVARVCCSGVQPGDAGDCGYAASTAGDPFDHLASYASESVSACGVRTAIFSHLRDTMSVKGVIRVSMHEPLTNLRRVVMVQFERGVAKTEIWRALYGVASLQPAVGKYVIAINEDIDPENGDAVFWALGYRANPALDVQILGHRARGHGPVLKGVDSDSTLLIDATLKADMPPVALPKREFMEDAKALWESLGLPELKPEAPWHGYSLGDWSDKWDAMAKRATDGEYLPQWRNQLAIAAQARATDAAEPGAGRRRSLDGEQQRISVDTPCRDGDDTEHGLCRNDGRHQFVVALQMSRNRVATWRGRHARTQHGDSAS